MRSARSSCATLLVLACAAGGCAADASAELASVDEALKLDEHSLGDTSAVLTVAEPPTLIEDMLDVAGERATIDPWAALTVPTVDRWFDREAEIVVILTFDDLAQPSSARQLRVALDELAVPSTFFVRGDFYVGDRPGIWMDVPLGSEAIRSPHWREHQAWLSRSEIGNHGFDHVAALYTWELLDQLTANERAFATLLADGTYPASTPRLPVVYRSPGCDAQLTITEEGFDILFAHRDAFGAPVIIADSSLPYIGPHAWSTGIVPPDLELRRHRRSQPYPYVVRRDEDGHALVELPYAYPSDGSAIDPRLRMYRSGGPRPGDRDDPLVDHLLSIFREIRAQRGVMVVVMHPWFQADAGDPWVDGGGKRPEGLIRMLTEMQRSPGVRFTTTEEAAHRYIHYLHASGAL